MRMTFVCAVVFLSGLWLGLAWQSPQAGADPEDAAPSASENGDTNGDGTRDLSDAVCLLHWLFQSGPEPVPFVPVSPPRFAPNGDGTVTDAQTGILWAARAIDANGDGAITYDDSVSKERATELLAEFSLAGHDDWVMPLTNELASLVVHPLETNALDPCFEIGEGDLWIASTNGGDPCHGASFTMSRSGFITLGQGALVLAVRRPGG
jgi:hypothetical protein